MSQKTQPKRTASPSKEEERLLSIGYLIHDASRLRLRYFDDIFKGWGLTHNNWWTLANIHAQGSKGISQGALGKMMGVKKAMMGTIIDQLEDSGYVKRSAGKRDRRVRTIKETAKGHTLSETMFDVVKAATPRFHNEISEEDLNITIKTLTRMQHNALGMIHDDDTEDDG